MKSDTKSVPQKAKKHLAPLGRIFRKRRPEIKVSRPATTLLVRISPRPVAAYGLADPSKANANTQARPREGDGLDKNPSPIPGKDARRDPARFLTGGDGQLARSSRRVKSTDLRRLFI